MVQNRNEWLFLWVQEMARNKVQFQKGLSEAQFAVLYGTEAQCREAVTRWRWPSGFVCPACGGKQHSVIKTRALYQCTACRRQTSVIAGTIFAATKVALTIWFRAMYHLTQSKGGISSIELGRRLGVTQTTSWKIKHKLMQVMMEREATKRLLLEPLSDGSHHRPLNCYIGLSSGDLLRQRKPSDEPVEQRAITSELQFAGRLRIGNWPSAVNNG